MKKIYHEPGLTLIKLGGYGLNIGRNFSGYASIRTWAWAVYDFADHVSPIGDKAAWADGVLAAGYPDIAYKYECWECDEWHHGSAGTMAEIKAIGQNLNVRMKVIG